MSLRTNEVEFRTKIRGTGVRCFWHMPGALEPEREASLHVIDPNDYR